jgi:Asp-tRNA(Asn)/Glu-tRNA(Gln) amidotransferase A subunit family amidase
MSRYPVLLCPVASIPAFRHNERQWTIDGRTVEYLDAVRHTQWFNTLGAPAAVVPVGRSPEGLPIGVQISARPFEDETALGVAAVVDEAFGYRPPPMALQPYSGSTVAVPGTTALKWRFPQENATLHDEGKGT